MLLLDELTHKLKPNLTACEQLEEKKINETVNKENIRGKNKFFNLII